MEYVLFLFDEFYSEWFSVKFTFEIQEKIDKLPFSRLFLH